MFTTYPTTNEALIIAEGVQPRFYGISEMTLQHRYTVVKAEREVIKTSRLGYDFVKQFYLNFMETVEVFTAIFLNAANEVVSVFKMSMGGVSQCIVDARLFISAASLCLASQVIVVHNHPSGALYPSAADKKITKKLQEICKLIDCPLLDHLIITNESYYSFAEDGLI